MGFFLFLLVAVLLSFWLFEYIPAGSVGVYDKLGTVKEQPYPPGVWWTGLLADIHEMSTRVQKVEYDASAASKDLQNVQTKVALNFRLKPESAPKMYREVGEEYVETIIHPIVQEAIKSQTALYDAEELIGKREQVKTAITDHLISKLSGQGLEVTEVSITNFDFSESFNRAIEEKQVAQQNALKAENQLKEMEYNAKAMQLQKEVIEIKRLDLQRAWIDKWNGQLPQFVTGGDQQMLVSVPMPTQVTQ